ncbi:MAG: hypothetical protein B6242_02745 [Anaerolineaceae bacterium 4572_78]|nr:MAG: hypothetical protein B6242_02745 [Anaerolineaceae bacterium 4572_78]
MKCGVRLVRSGYEILLWGKQGLILKINTTVSVIVTVLNEGQTLCRLLDSLVAQSRSPDEVVIVDGGSSDDTIQYIRQYQDKLPLKLIVEKGANISRGRNIAIEHASHPIIASTDAGVKLSENWLADLVAPFEDSADETNPHVVAGFFLPDSQTTFEVAMGATVLPRLADINPITFLPSSRSIAFSKTAWQAVGGYPEWLDYCEDLIFDFKLRDKFGIFIFVPQAIAYFQPRGNLKSFFKQYYRYARGDGKADLWRLRHAVRYSTYLFGIPMLFALGKYVSKWWWFIGALIGSYGLFFTPYRRLMGSWHDLHPIQKLKAIYWVPIIRVTGDIAKMIGFPVGWWWRSKHRVGG